MINSSDIFVIKGVTVYNLITYIILLHIKFVCKIEIKLCLYKLWFTLSVGIHKSIMHETWDHINIHIIQLKNILSLACMPGLYPINVQMSKSSIRKKLTAKKSIKIFYNILHKLPSIYILCEPCVLCVCQSACVQ